VALFRRRAAGPGETLSGTIVADQAYRCNLCLEAVSRGDRMFRCSCAQVFHDSCTPEAVSCPKCGSPIRAPMPEVGRREEADVATISRIERAPPRPVAQTSFSEAVESARRVWSESPSPTPNPEPTLPHSSSTSTPTPHASLAPEIEDIYLIHRKSGLLIQRRTWRRETTDADLVTGMLDAVRGFISQSFSRSAGPEFSRFHHGDHVVLVYDGSLVSLAIAVSGGSDEMLRLRADLVKEEMRQSVAAIENAHRRTLEGWKGNIEALRGARKNLDAVAASISHVIEPDEKSLATDTTVSRPPTASSFSAGLNYLVLDPTPIRSYEAVGRLMRDGRSCLVISTTLPSKLRKQYDIGNSDILWLTEGEGSGVVRPERLEFEVQRIVSAFFREHPDGVFLLDGIEFLIVTNGHERVVKFAKRVADLAGAGGGTFLVPLNPGPIPADPLGVLRRTFDRVEEGR